MADNKIKISASILSADFGRLQEEVDFAQSADSIHFDVMDGHFVPNITMGAAVLKSLSSKIPVSAHLMIEDPLKYAKDFIDAGASEIIVHSEACVDLKQVVLELKKLNVSVGVAISPDTSVDAVMDVLDDVDMVLVMSVRPGFAGQKFMPEVLDKVRALRSAKADLDIGMDGGINADNISECVAAGATTIAAASAIFKGDIEKNISQLRSRVE